MSIRITILSMTLLFLVIGCSSEPEPAAPEPSRSIETAPRSAPSVSSRAAPAASTASQVEDNLELIAKPRLTGRSPVPGNGLETVIFATTREEYAESLSMIAEETSDEQYQQLDAALRWLMINDASIMNDEARLFERINGKTGTEILQMTADQVQNRGG